MHKSTTDVITDTTDDATDALLQTAREFGWGNARPGDVIAAAYRLAAAKLRENGNDQLAGDLEAAPVDAARGKAQRRALANLETMTDQLEAARAVFDALAAQVNQTEHVFFYERDFYVLSNFSAFRLRWRGHDFDTSEAAYQWSKFYTVQQATICVAIRQAPSAHEAFKIAERNAQHRRPDWDLVRVDIMRGILRAKIDQHEYVRRKLLATGERQLIEDSWRDSFWGWGPHRDGKNMLGKLWMEIRAELRRQG
jgi:ribA/ribD-fused uncharacterized protein